ncbi:MAG: M42 family metallopeptidase [Crenarchaeota archaeon]|nr:M42 family metallopeptidase [Thermoproteota archaeon]
MSREEFFKLLKRLADANGPTGREGSVRDIVVEELKEVADEVRIDALGNVIAVKKGRGSGRFMLAAHMDEIALIVSYIDEKGFVKFLPVGGVMERNVVGQRVRIITRSGKVVRGVIGLKPPHAAKPEEARQLPEMREMFIDIGASSRAEAEAMGVSVGDFIVFDRELVRLGEKRVTGKALDDRVGVAVMIAAFKELGETDASIYAVATVQEEVGLKGARTAAFSIDPHAAIAIDVTIAQDIPGVEEHEYVTRLGKGPAIKVIDGRKGTGLISDQRLVDKLIEVAKAKSIPFQVEVAPGGTTDASAINLTREGVPAATISIPTRYLHSAVELLDLDDAINAAKLLKEFAESIPSSWLEELRGKRIK